VSWLVDWTDTTDGGHNREPAADEAAAVRRVKELSGAGARAIAWEQADLEDTA
jgi:hypothetical protein